MMDPRMMQQMQQQQMLGMQRPPMQQMAQGAVNPQAGLMNRLDQGLMQNAPTATPQNWGSPMEQGMQRAFPNMQRIDPRTGRPMQHQQPQAVESPLPADPFERMQLEMLRDEASRARDEEMLKRSIEQKKIRNLVGQTGMNPPRRNGMLDPQSVMTEREADPRSVVREQEMFRRMR